MLSLLDNSTIVNLKVVASLRRGQRLNTKLHLYSICEPHGIVSSAPLLRWWQGESREHTVNSLTNLFRSVTSQVGKNANNSEVRFAVTQLIRSAVGLRNLMSTYEDDPTVSAALSYILENVEHFIRLRGTTEDVALFHSACIPSLGALHEWSGVPEDHSQDLVPLH